MPPTPHRDPRLPDPGPLRPPPRTPQTTQTPLQDPPGSSPAPPQLPSAEWCPGPRGTTKVAWLTCPPPCPPPPWEVPPPPPPP